MPLFRKLTPAEKIKKGKMSYKQALELIGGDMLDCCCSAVTILNMLYKDQDKQMSDDPMLRKVDEALAKGNEAMKLLLRVNALNALSTADRPLTAFREKYGFTKPGADIVYLYADTFHMSFKEAQDKADYPKRPVTDKLLREYFEIIEKHIPAFAKVCEGTEDEINPVLDKVMLDYYAWFGVRG